MYSEKLIIANWEVCPRVESVHSVALDRSQQGLHVPAVRNVDKIQGYEKCFKCNILASKLLTELLAVLISIYLER